MIVIVAARVTVSWITEDQDSDYAALTLVAVGNDSAVVPAIRHWEIANVLLVLEWRNRLTNVVATFSRVMRHPIDLENLDYRKDHRRAIFELELAHKHRLSVYDAAYLALAKQTATPLATLDAKLASAAKAEGLLFDLCSSSQ